MVEKLKINSIGSGIPLVFIHGWGLNSGVWQPLIEQLSQGYEIITVDLPGFGNNHQIDLQPYSMEQVVLSIIESVAKPAVYIGWSLGGLVAMNIAISQPKEVLGLVTIASSPCFVEKENWPGMKPMVLKSFYQQLAKNSQKTIENFLKIQAMGSPQIRDDIRQLHQLIMQYPQPRTSVLTQSLSLLEQVDLRLQLEQISCPVFRMYGRLDSLVPKQVPKKVAQLLPQSDELIFEKASHAPFMSHASEFQLSLSAWLENNMTTMVNK